MGNFFFLSAAQYHYLPAWISQSHITLQSTQGEVHMRSTPTHRDRSTNPRIQWLTHGDKTALSWAVNSQTRETFWTEMLLEGLPSFPEITVTEAHELEVGRIWKPQKGGTWLCFLKLPSSSTRKDTGGGTGLDSSKSWVLLIHSGN